MKKHKSIIAVPARLESSRLPNKILADIAGKSMIRRTLERCRLSKFIEKVILCTDNLKLKEKAEAWGFKVLLTSKDCNSGSERISTVVNELVGLAWESNQDKLNIETLISNTSIINVQGDQPLIDPVVIDLMAKKFEKDPNIEVITPIYKLSPDNIHNPNVVKTLVGNRKNAIYFSRSAIPHVRDKDPNQWHKHAKYWGHVGIYGFRGDVLNQWNNLPKSELEEVEKLEQLRIIDGGFKISTFEVEGNFLSVDTKEQLEEARRRIEEQ